MARNYFFLFILFFSFNEICHAQNEVSNYNTYFASAAYNGSDVIVLRKFQRQNELYYLIVNSSTLHTDVIPAKGLKTTESTLEQLTRQFGNASYIKAFQTSRTQSFSIQDAGIIHGYPKEKGITLTIDLCPSHKPLDRDLFSNLVQAFSSIEKPVPAALSLSGRFMLTHEEDINWLKSLVNKGDITITWINHTYNHHFDPKTPLAENFLLAPGTDLDFEILGTEIAMLQHGLIPSVFFRFPGLVSDNSIVNKVCNYGLIPIGSDAWLAKGQKAGSGSIVLIHGNGNEPVGIKDFIQLLKSEKDKVLEKQWLLYDLRESVSNEFKN